MESKLVSVAGRGDVEAARRLVKAGCDVNSRSEQQIPITAAALNENLPMVKYLVQQGCNVNLKNLEGNTALTYAVDNDDIKMASLLLRCGADVNTHDSQQTPLIILACCRGTANNFDMLRLLIHAGGNVNTTSADRKTPLHHVIYHSSEEYVDTVKMLLGAGAKVNAQDVNGCSPLMCAVASQKVSTVMLLLKAGCKVNLRDKICGRTALHHAVLTKHAPSVLVLLQHGANPDILDKDRSLPLIQATYNNDADTVRFLVLHNSDVMKRGCCCGKTLTAWDMALHRRNHLILQMLFAAGGLPRSSALQNQRKAPMLFAANNKPLHEWLQDIFNAPMKLSGLCRLFIRRCLGLRIYEKLKMLKLPISIEAFLSFTGDMLFIPPTSETLYEVVIQ